MQFRRSINIVRNLTTLRASQIEAAVFNKISGTSRRKNYAQFKCESCSCMARSTASSLPHITCTSPLVLTFPPKSWFLQLVIWKVNFNFLNWGAYEWSVVLMNCNKEFPYVYGLERCCMWFIQDGAPPHFSIILGSFWTKIMWIDDL